jgi:hypothetical protein
VSSLEVNPEFVVKLFRRGDGDVGIQLVRRGGVFGTPMTFPGDVHAAINLERKSKQVTCHGSVGG